MSNTARRFSQRTRAPRGRWPGGLQRGNGLQRGHAPPPGMGLIRWSIPPSEEEVPRLPSRQEEEEEEDEEDAKIIEEGPRPCLSLNDNVGAVRTSRESSSLSSAPPIPSSVTPNPISTPANSNLPTTRPLYQTPDRAALYSSVVLLLVGSSATPYHIHKGLLCRASSFFRSALSSPRFTNPSSPLPPDSRSPSQPSSQTINLPNDNSEIFQYFHLYLYTNQLFDADTPISTIPWTLLIDLYAWGEKHGAPLFQDKVMDALVAKMGSEKRGGIPMGVVERIFQVGAGKVPALKKLAIECYGAMDVTEFKWAMLPDTEGSGYSGGVPAEFWVELSILLKTELARDGASYQPSTPSCRFHLHASDETCSLS